MAAATMTDVTAGMVAVNSGGEFADDGEALLMVVVTLGSVVPDVKMMMVDSLR